MDELVAAPQKTLPIGTIELAPPTMIVGAGEASTKRFIAFFTAHIRNANTREAYSRAVRDFFAWCEAHELHSLIDLEAVHVAAYIEQMTTLKAAQTVKQHLAAIKAVFDFLVTGGVLLANPDQPCAGHGTQPRKARRRSYWLMMPGS